MLGDLLHEFAGDGGQVKTVKASVHVQGLEVIDKLDDDGSGWVVTTMAWLPATTPLVECSPNESRIYRLFARRGSLTFFSQGAPFGGSNQIINGLFGMVIVEPKGSTWYSEPGHSGAPR